MSTQPPRPHGPDTAATALDRLALQLGIEPEYETATGEVRHVPLETKRNLMAAMGYPVASEADAELVLERLETSARANPLPPVIVAREDAELEVEYQLGDPGRSLALEIELETGEVIRDRAIPSAAQDARRSREGGGSGWRLQPARKLPLGYHRLTVDDGGTRARTSLIIAPRRCWLPAPLVAGARIWGITAQLYALRAAPEWGIGDFTTLGGLAAFAGARGASLIGLNPLHALFLEDPEQASPYSPASRLFLNPLYIDPAAIPEFVTCERLIGPMAGTGFAGKLEHARTGPLVNYTAVAELKLETLGHLWRAFQRGAPPERRAAFAQFRTAGGLSLDRFCLFQALRDHHRQQSPERADWRRWPRPLREPDSEASRAFAREHAERIDFYAWLQWQADEQLGDAAAQAQAAGLALGLYRDLAVGAASSGAETWSNPGVVVEGVHVGAPPDLFNPAGQDWGLPAFDPNKLRAEAYRSFVELLRANMRHAGGLRIDHIMALQHLYWIPAGHPATEGAYVAYPFEEMLAVLALESHRQHCFIVGEDLGTVPKGFRERLADNGILSYKVVFFEWREDDSFKGPEEYARDSLATIGSHDLATLHGWWEGHDIELKARGGLYPSVEEAAAQRTRRAQDRERFLAALREANLALPAGLDGSSPWSSALASAAHAFLARTGSAIAMVQIEDLADQLEQMNLPGSVTEYANWRRKLPLTLEQLDADAGAATLCCILGAARPAVAAAAAPGTPAPAPQPGALDGVEATSSHRR